MESTHRILRVFLVGPYNDSWRDAVRNPDKSLSKWRHQEVRSIADADLLFWWATPHNARSIETWFQLGQAVALDRSIIAVSESKLAVFATIAGETGKSSEELLEKLKIDVKNSPIERGVLSSYEVNMADLDLIRPSRFYRSTATVYCRCEVCGCLISRGEAVVRSAFRGVFHIDCHEAKYDPKNLSDTIFNSRLIEALREENAKLEQELEKYRR